MLLQSCLHLNCKKLVMVNGLFKCNALCLVILIVEEEGNDEQPTWSVLLIRPRVSGDELNFNKCPDP